MDQFIIHYHISQFAIYVVARKMTKNGTTHRRNEQKKTTTKMNRILYSFCFCSSTPSTAAADHLVTMVISICLRIDRSKTNKIVTSQNLYLIKSVSFYFVSFHFNTRIIVIEMGKCVSTVEPTHTTTTLRIQHRRSQLTHSRRLCVRVWDDMVQ